MAELHSAASKDARVEGLMTISQWRAALASRRPAVRDALAAIYGEGREAVDQREAKLAEMIEAFAAAFGDARAVVAARAPGRVNLMGRHIDHRGGFINTIAIPNDVWIVAAARDDGRLSLRNLDPAFEPHDLDPTALWQAAATADWRDFVDSDATRAFLAGRRGSWANYGLGAWLRLRRAFGDRLAGGFDALYWGDVPRSVGLSSSSSVFVATAIAVARLGGMEVDPDCLATLCGEGEWFVGTRGGAGDHAAMLYGRRGKVSQIGFFPMRLERQASLPDDLEIILCNSGERAQKSREARDRFNGRVAAYEIALAVLRDRQPGLTARVEHLRDLSPGRLGVGAERIYGALKSVPVWMTRDEIAAALHGRLEPIEHWFSTHGDLDGGYPLRAVLLYGIAECERSRCALETMSGGDPARIRRLFAISHDGDRVTARASGGQRRPWTAACDNGFLDDLIRRLRDDDSARCESAELAWQPGAYGCSTPGIDEMVDIANAVDGVLGAQLVGAGLGGSIVVLARTGTAARLAAALERGYYTARGIAPEVHVFQPAAGASCFAPAFG